MEDLISKELIKNKIYFSNQKILLLQGNSLELLPHLFPETIDLIVTDPPYESLRKWEGVGTTARMGLGIKGSKAEDPNKFYPTITNIELGNVLQEFYRIVKQNCHTYVMCDTDTLPVFYNYMKKLSFSNIKPLIWDKQKMGMGYHYRCQYEFIMMLDKGKNRRLNSLSMSDILSYKFTDKKIVPTQKPVELFKALIKQSSKVNEIILDPFLGSGTALEAAIKTDRRFIGIEMNPEYLKIAKERIHCSKDLF